MIRATLSSLRAHKMRLLMSAISVVLGVLAVTGSLVLTDTLRRSYSAMFNDVYDYVDVSVSVPPRVDTGYLAAPATMPASVLDQLRDLPQVAKATGNVSTQDGARVVGRDGKVVTTLGAPRIGLNWTGDDEFVDLRTGRGPIAEDEVAINAGLAETTGYTVGDRIGVLTLAPRRTFTVVGVFGYSGNRDSLAGETIVAFTLPAAQQLLAGEKNVLTSIDLVAAAGVSSDQLRAVVAGRLGPSYRVQTAAELSRQASESVDQGFRFFDYILLGFAFVALFVGVFLILNTFSIIVVQRLRELALLRAMGASRAQVIGSVETEALIVGVVSSVTGVLLGVGVGRLLAWLYSTYLGGGVDLAPLNVPPAAVLAGLGMGIAVTMLAALAPALRAARIPPVAALRESDAGADRLSRITVAGAVLTLAGAALLAAGLTDHAGPGNPLVVLLGGVLLILSGVALLTPALVRPVLVALGTVFAWWTPGRLGARNSARQPRRTAITAAALMVGISLVVGIGVVLTSVSKSFDQALGNRIKVDLIIAGEQTGPLPPTFDGSVLDRARRMPDVATVLGFATDIALLDGEQATIGAVTDSTAMRSTFGMRTAAGTIDGLGAGQLLVDERTAAAAARNVGDRVRVQLTKGDARTFTIVGIYTQTPGLSGWLTGDAERKNFRTANPSTGFVRLAPGASEPAVHARIADLLSDSPEATVSDRSGYLRQQTRVLDSLRAMVQVLMALAIIIAVLGIVNTLALSVIERTRELGLLRAIGLRRGQVVGMIGVESVLISVFGALLGVVLGVLLGAATVQGLHDQGIDALGLPWGQMAAYLVLGVAIGVVASIAPAVRAARLNVLTAVAYE
ncbi:ABC transporter permease [Actinoplanes awajinensis]|uniref:ABC transporter permease n=1 Tax=Actinoplanes awajinensis subsp. mycoplanecinus TaxID=135947 RepID=A0A117MLG2_9ACTN|nr:ABC transporter permease [Actinoplanes awajinensis]KUL23907.1 ABC transporter permease [Actinoplanes awajinensis subsp. mycoplanecinus]